MLEIGWWQSKERRIVDAVAILELKEVIDHGQESIAKLLVLFLFLHDLL